MATSSTLLIPPDDGGTRWDLVKALALGLASAAVVFIATIGFITLLNTSTTLNDVKSIIKGHSATLGAIHVNTSETKRIADGLKKGDLEVDQILMEAGTTSKSLLTDMSEILSQNSAICTAVHTTC